MGIGGWWTGIFIALASFGIERFTVAPPNFFDLVPEEDLTRTTTAAPPETPSYAPTESEDPSEERPSFFRRRREMAPVSKWNLFYVSTGRGRGKVALAIGRLYPKKSNDATWTVVDNARRVTTLNINDRRRVSVKRTAGVTWEEFAGLSREGKREAEEASRDLVLRASRPSLVPWGKKLSWLLTPLTVLLSWSMFGFTGLGLSLFWRSAQYVLPGLRDHPVPLRGCLGPPGHHLRRHGLHLALEEAWSRGDFELPHPVIGKAIFVGCGLWTWARWIFPSSISSPPPSESGSEAGHSLPASEDEKESRDEIKNLIDTLQAEVKTLREEKTRAGRRRPPTRHSMDTDPSSGMSSAWEVLAGDESGSDTAGSARLPAPPNPETMVSAVDSILRRLKKHEMAVHMERAGAACTTALADSPSAPPGLSRSSAAATAGSGDVDTARLRDALRDPRERVLEQLEGLKQAVDWSFPANVSERVALPLLVQIFSTRPSATQMAQRWAQDKQLERNHVAHEMLLMCMVLDKSLLSIRDFVNMKGCEIIARRNYALKKAFENVRNVNDWRQPKSAAGRKWKSKVRWDLANEIDLRALSGEVEALPGFDGELQGRLNDRALLTKYVDQAAAVVGITKEL